jgi:AcrR family transcriptional regulator
VGYRHDQESILKASMHVVLAEGVSALSYGRVAKELAISDRMVVYYFPAKSDLISAVIVAIGSELQLMLEEAFGSEPLSAKELMRRAWPVLSVKKAQSMFNGFFEVIGLASAGQSPYDELAPVLLNGWIDWLADRVKAQNAVRRREIAASVVAQIDGLLMIRRISGARIANAAARELGIA